MSVASCREELVSDIILIFQALLFTVKLQQRDLPCRTVCQEVSIRADESQARFIRCRI